MEKKYNRNDIDENFSMGESALLYYDDILEKNVLNRIIISTILRLHKKGYVELNKTNENELVINIKNGTKKLRISETFIYECLKIMDSDGDGRLTLNELRVSENNIIATHKKNIKELIIQEAMADKLIDSKKFKQKRKYFFRALEFLAILLIPILWTFISPVIVILLMVAITILLFLNMKGINYSKDLLKALKNKLIHDEMMKYSSKDERKSIIIEFILCIVIYCVQLYVLGEIFPYIMWNTIVAESVIFFIIAIAEYIKFTKAHVYTGTAIQYRDKLKRLEEYLKEYSLIENRKAIEVYLWEDYLAFSVLLGINKVIPKEFNLDLSDNDKRGKLQYDYYENKYYYINDKDEKIYVD